MQPNAGGADDSLIFVFSLVIVFVRPMLDVAAQLKMKFAIDENDGTATPEHDPAQCVRKATVSADRRIGLTNGLPACYLAPSTK